MPRYQVIEAGVLSGPGDLRKEAVYLAMSRPFGPEGQHVQGYWRKADGSWASYIFDTIEPGRTVLANLEFCDGLEHAEEIFLGAWATANRIADAAGAPVPRNMLHNSAGEILLGDRFEICCYPDGAFRVVVFHGHGHPGWGAKVCETEAETIAALRDFLALKGEK